MTDAINQKNVAGFCDESFQEILALIAERRGLDFSAYRESTIRRRLAHRIQMSGAPDEVVYRSRIDKDPKELDALIDALTINVSHFFRNPLVFEVLREFVLPELLDLCSGRALRIWSVGCAGGEEAYSAAIMARDVLHAATGRCDCFILATDIDRAALASSAAAAYQSDSLPEVRKKHLDACFTRRDETWTVRSEIKSMVTFAYHDAVTCKPPAEGIFTDYHLVLCRNVLIYFNRETRRKVLRWLVSLLPPGGFLALGDAESAADEPGLAEAFPRTRIYRKRIHT